MSWGRFAELKDACVRRRIKLRYRSGLINSRGLKPQAGVWSRLQRKHQCKDELWRMFTGGLMFGCCHWHSWPSLGLIGKKGGNSHFWCAFIFICDECNVIWKNASRQHIFFVFVVVSSFQMQEILGLWILWCQPCTMLFLDQFFFGCVIMLPNHAFLEEEKSDETVWYIDMMELFLHSYLLACCLAFWSSEFPCFGL